mmetsp:Transcript_95406/g.274765  ORF Transcript_95406/g.274765 Transcript_95406/m.274765 type:complete len:201 (-) Transcript_95406:227-829(-)
MLQRRQPRPQQRRALPCGERHARPLRARPRLSDLRGRAREAAAAPQGPRQRRPQRRKRRRPRGRGHLVPVRARVAAASSRGASRGAPTHRCRGGGKISRRRPGLCGVKPAEQLRGQRRRGPQRQGREGVVGGRGLVLLGDHLGEGADDRHARHVGSKWPRRLPVVLQNRLRVPQVLLERPVGLAPRPSPLLIIALILAHV